MIAALRVIAGRESQVMDLISARAKKENLAIYSLFKPHEIRGYIFVEAENPDEILRAIKGISQVKGLVKGEVDFEEISHFLEERPTVIDINIGDIVEITGGPFKGGKAKVTRVNKLKEEIVVELLDAAVPIPITLKIDNVRVIEHANSD